MSDKASLTTLSHTLVLWYRENRRDLPWRRTRDPYSIWVSETMLQQTRVESVIPYYQSFLAKFPTVRDLALADDDTVLKMWQGLGYYSRVRNLHKAAKAVVELHDGVITGDVEAFRALPGVGPYTVGAVMSIAFDLPVPAVDGNVLRVMARFLGIYDAIETQAAKRPITKLVQEWLDDEVPSDLTQALMELGATVCIPKKPACLACPLSQGCTAFKTGETQSLPIRQKKKARKVVDVLALWLEENGHVLMQQRPDEGLLANMWQLPAIEFEPGRVRMNDGDIMAALAPQLHPIRDVREFVVAECGLSEFVQIAQEKHIFSHIEWNVSVVRPMDSAVTRQLINYESTKGFSSLVPISEVEDLALPRVYEKIIQYLLEHRQGVDEYGLHTS